MSTIEITAIEDLREGDYVTLRWEFVDGATVTLEGPMWNRMVGAYAVTDARFVSATREVPEWEPGTVYEITTLNGDTERAWYMKRVLGGSAFVTREGDEFTVEELASIQPVPDDAETLRRDVVKYKEAARKYQREHDKECAEVERLEAEVKRLRDSMDTNTNFLISSNGTIWHHDTHCPNRRTMPTRKQIADALWPDAPESARAGMTELGILDRIVELFEQGGAS